MKDTPLDYMVYQTLKKLIEKSKIDPQVVEDVCLGNVSFPPTIPPSYILINPLGQ